MVGLEGDSRRLVALAAPIAATQLAQIAVSTTNIALMGTLGVDQIAAGGLAMVLFNQIRTMCVGLITASGNHIAYIAGRCSGSAGRTADSDDDIRDVVRAGLVVATVAGVLGAIVLAGLGWALQWLGQDTAVLAHARPMLLALAPGLVPCLWFQALRQYSIGLHRPQALLAVTLGSVAMNLVLAIGLMNRFGLTGIGVATSLVHTMTFLVFALIVRQDPVLGPTLPRRLRPIRLAAVRAELRLGTPIALTYGSEAGMFSVLALVMGHIGPAALAAHNIVYQLVYIVFQLAVGLSQGVSILVSGAVAGEQFRRAHRLAGLALGHSGVLVGLVGLVYVVAPDQALRLFTDRIDTATAELAHTLLLVAITLQFVDAAQNIGVGLLRGVGDTAAAFRLSLVGYWLVGLPTALGLAFPAHLDGVGVWLGLTAGLAATAGLMLRRYYSLLAAKAPATRPTTLPAN